MQKRLWGDAQQVSMRDLLLMRLLHPEPRRRALLTPVPHVPPQQKMMTPKKVRLCLGER